MSKTLIYSLVLLVNFSLIFSNSKPCCNKKAGNTPVSCKTNKVNTTEDNTPSENIKQPLKCNAQNEGLCLKTINKAWWKFWVKQENDFCNCDKNNLKSS